MNGRTIWGAVLGLVVVAVLVGVGIQLYEIGVAHGMSQAAQITATTPGAAPGVAPQPGAVPYPYYGYGPYRPWGWGWGWGFPFFGLLIPLLFFLLIFALFRAAWRGPRRWGGWGGWGPGAPPTTFEDWHRRAHERDQAPPAGQPTTT